MAPPAANRSVFSGDKKKVISISTVVQDLSLESPSRSFSSIPSNFDSASIRDADFTLTWNLGYKFSLNPVETFVNKTYICVLKECLDQVYVLRDVLSPFAATYDYNTIAYKTLEERYGFGVLAVDPYQLNEEYTDMHKFQKDAGLLIYLLKIFIDEADNNSTFYKIHGLMKILRKMNEDEQDLWKEVEKKEKHFQELRIALVDEKVLNRDNVCALDIEVRDCMEDYYDEQVYYKEKVAYIKKWEYSRREQNALKLRQSETDYVSKIFDMRKALDREEICHEDIEAFIKECNEDYMEEIEKMMDKYEDHIEKKENDIYYMKLDIDKMAGDREILHAKFEERAMEIEEYLEHKRKKKEELDRLALQNYAANLIQTWWRGIMMKKKLGPYKKKGKKHGKKGGKKAKRRY